MVQDPQKENGNFLLLDRDNLNDNMEDEGYSSEEEVLGIENDVGDFTTGYPLAYEDDLSIFADFDVTIE